MHHILDTYIYVIICKSQGKKNEPNFVTVRKFNMITKILTVLVLLCVSKFSLASTTQGTKYQFKIPDSPVGTEYALNWAIEHRAFSGPNANQSYRDHAFRRCPKISKLVFSIFDRLISSNKLEAFADGPIGLRISMNCLGVFATGTGVGDHANETGAITIQSSLVKVLKTEDELAFVLSHEIAHVLLAHPQLKFDWRRTGMTTPNPTSKQEAEADRLGAILSANAGYNVRSSGPLALWHLMQFLTDSLIIKFSPVIIDSTGQGSDHGSIGDRATRIIESANNANVVDERLPRQSPFLKEALAEFNSIRSTFKNQN